MLECPVVLMEHQILLPVRLALRAEEPSRFIADGHALCHVSYWTLLGCLQL